MMRFHCIEVSFDQKFCCIEVSPDQRFYCIEVSFLKSDSTVWRCPLIRGFTV